MTQRKNKSQIIAWKNRSLLKYLSNDTRLDTVSLRKMVNLRFLEFSQRLMMLMNDQKVVEKKFYVLDT